MAIRTSLFRCRRYSTPRKDWPRSACRRNGTYRPASATASIRRDCATAANFSRARSRRSVSASRPLFDRDVSLHVGMEFAVIVDLARFRQFEARLLVGQDHVVPGFIAIGRGVRDDILVRPLDGVADASGNVDRTISHLVDYNMDGL